MAGEQQHLVALRGVEQHTLHLLQPGLVAVHQRVVQDQQRRPAGGLQQVGVGEAADQAHLFARAEAQRVEVAGLGAARAVACQRARHQLLVHGQPAVGKQQLQVVVQVPLQRRLQALRQGLAALVQPLQQELQRLGAALQLVAAALGLGQFGLLARQLFFQPLRAGGAERGLELRDLAVAGLVLQLQLLGAAAQALDVLAQDVGPRRRDAAVDLLQPCRQRGLVRAGLDQRALLRRQLGLQRRVGERGLQSVALAAGGVELAGGGGQRLARGLQLAAGGVGGVARGLVLVFGAVDWWRRGAVGRGRWQPCQRRFGLGLAGLQRVEFQPQRVQALGRQQPARLVGGLGIGQALRLGAVARLGVGQCRQAQALQQGLVRVLQLRVFGRQVGQVAAAGRDVQPAHAVDLQRARRHQQPFALAGQRLAGRGVAGQAQCGAGHEVEVQPCRHRGLADLQLLQPRALRAQRGEVACGDARLRRLALQRRGARVLGRGAGQLRGQVGCACAGVVALALQHGAGVFLARQRQRRAGGLQARRRRGLGAHGLRFQRRGLLVAAAGVGKRRLARGELRALLRGGLQPLREQGAQAAGLAQRLGFAFALGAQRLHRLQRRLGRGLLRAQRGPGLGLLVLQVRVAQAPQLVDLVAVAVHRLLQRGHALLQRRAVVEGLLVRGARLAGAGEQLVLQRLHLRRDVVAAAGRHGAQRGVERTAQVVAGVDHGVAHGVARALLDPQQARDAPVLLLARALAGELEAQHLGQEVLGLDAFQRAVAHQQLAALLVQETLAQPVGGAAGLEVDLHQRRGGAVAIGPQVVDAGGAVALEERGADGAHQRALAGLVGAAEDVQAGLQVGQLEGGAELPQLGHAQALQLHAASVRRARAASRPVSSARASCARRASSPVVSRSSAISAPR